MKREFGRISFIDRLFSALSYLSAGWFGLIISVILYFRKKSMSRFLQFNIFQSIFISLLFFVLSFGIGLIFKLLSYIPFVNYLVAHVTFLFNVPVVFNYSIIQVFLTGLLIYLCVFSLLGKYPRLFWVSKIIGNSVR